MDSSNSSEKSKMQAGNRFASRLKKLQQDPASRATLRRDKVAVDLSIALAESGMTRQSVADTAGIKLSQLSRQLAGETNLTLDSIGKICEAIGYEFDVVLRKSHYKPATQPWQKPNAAQVPESLAGAHTAPAQQRRRQSARAGAPKAALVL